MKFRAMVITPMILAAVSAGSSAAVAEQGWSHPNNGYITNQVNAVRAIQPAGTPFTAGLQEEYLWLADTEYAAHDLSDTLSYAALARRAAGGEEVPPADPVAWGLNEQSALKLSDARVAESRLNGVFAAGGKSRAPGPSARAQVAFDCMVRESCPLETHPGVAGCADRFWSAIQQAEAMLQPVQTSQPVPQPQPAPAPAPVIPPPPLDYLVFFDFDQADIRLDSAQILDQVVQVIRKLGVEKVVLIGHADRSGSMGYNQRLSERRASAVRMYLASKGLSGVDIATSGHGETDLRVPTPDGEREQENRRVEIHLVSDATPTS